MKVIRRRATAGIAACLVALALVAAGCGSDGGSDSGSDGGGDSAGGDKSLTMAVVPGWTDETSTTALLKKALEDKGYTIEVKEFSEPALIFAGLAKGDIDVFSSAWPEATHKKYMDQYGGDIEDIATWYDTAKLTMAVPDYVDVTSIDELPDHSAEFDGKIIGIEPGAGLTGVVKDSVIPAYGLDSNYTLVTSSTTAMLTELKKAVDDQSPIVVTLWRPYWANLEFPMRDLEDPKGALGASEGLHVLAHKGFSDANPDVAAMLAKFKMDDEQYGSLEDLVVNNYEAGQEDQAVDEWLKSNPDFMKTLG